MIRRRNSADERLRRADRDGDLAARARELVRQGRWRDLSTSELLEQQLGPQDRIELAYEVRDSDWSDWSVRRDFIREAADLLGLTLPARLAADYASRVPQGPAGRQAIFAAQRWADDPAEQNRQAAAAAYYAARDAAATYGAADAARAAVRAAYRAAAAAAFYALDAAADAAAAFYAARAAAADAFYAAAYASSASNASNTAAADASSAEQNWQKWRLVRYLVAPDWPSPVPITDAP